MNRLSNRPQNKNIGQRTPKLCCINCKKEMGVNAFVRHNELRCSEWLRRLKGQQTKKRPWNKGLTKDCDPRLANQGQKYSQKVKSGQIKRFRQTDNLKIQYWNDCRFKFNVYDYPELFDISLLQELGWYHPVTNTTGVSRDHRISISYGWKHKIDASYISHPYNCRLVTHKENNRKKISCDIDVRTLIENIENVPVSGKATGRTANPNNAGSNPAWHSSKKRRL